MNIYIFPILGVDKFRFWGGRTMSNNIFKVCSHIQKNTQNPNPIFKITINYTKDTNNAKILSNKFKSSKSLFCILYKLHNPYF